MAKRSTTATVNRKAAVADDEEDEEEVVVVSTKRKAPAPVAKASTNGKVATKPVAKTVAKKPAKADDEEGAYTPNPNSMRDFVMRAMKRGGTAAEIKGRAARFAAKKEIENLSDAKAYKNFDIVFFAKMLKSKGYDVDIDEAGDSYKLNA